MRHCFRNSKRTVNRGRQGTQCNALSHTAPGVYRVDVAPEMERNEATAKHAAWPSCAWLQLNFFPFPAGHPPHPPCTGVTLANSLPGERDRVSLGSESPDFVLFVMWPRDLNEGAKGKARDLPFAFLGLANGAKQSHSHPPPCHAMANAIFRQNVEFRCNMQIQFAPTKDVE